MTGAKKKIALTRRFPKAVEERARRDYDARISADDAPLGADGLAELSKNFDGLLIAPTDKIDAALIARLDPRCKMIATFSVGIDHLDVEAARAKGIAMSNTPDVLTDATAEIALLALLGAARRAHEGQTLLRAGQWTGWTPTQLMGAQLTGKRLGIVGMGRIGQAVAKRARAFDMIIHYSNRNRLAPAREQGAVYHADPEAMLPQCDALSFHCPASPAMRHFLDARRIELLPKGAIVVNTARGMLIDDDALIAALKSGRVAAAGLDVFNNEPNVHTGYFPIVNAFLLPHMGSATLEARNAMGFRALDNLDAFFAGKTPPHAL
jgi:lactate dehydrogenase-like 2-hydroxyacid dehydrogenase